MSLVLEEISLEREGKKLFDEISVQLEGADWLGIIGPNGAGKTSLLKSLLHIYPDYSGEISYLGKNISEFSARQRALIFSYLPQGNTDINGNFSVLDVMKFSRFAHSSSFTIEFNADEARKALKIFDVEHLADRFFGQLSGGERQRCMLAAAYFQKAKYLILDEPTSFLDPSHVKEMVQNFRILKGEMQSVILVTHDINLAKNFCEQLLMLKEGKVFKHSSSKDLCLDDLNELYGTEFTSTPINNRDFFHPVYHL